MGLDEKENADRTRGTVTISAADTALTRRILLKLDFRYSTPDAPMIDNGIDACFAEFFQSSPSCSSVPSSTARMSEMQRRMVLRLV